jgi:hypothetical protein
LQTCQVSFATDIAPVAWAPACVQDRRVLKLWVVNLQWPSEGMRSSVASRYLARVVVRSRCSNRRGSSTSTTTNDSLQRWRQHPILPQWLLLYMAWPPFPGVGGMPSAMVRQTIRPLLVQQNAKMFSHGSFGLHLAVGQMFFRSSWMSKCGYVGDIAF